MELDSESDKPEPEPSETTSGQASNILPDGGNILLPSWLRCRIQGVSRLDGFLLDYSFNFLLPVSAFCWLLCGVAFVV